jgi:hypothetical protein
MIKKSLKSKRSKSHTWAPLNRTGGRTEEGKEKEEESQTKREKRKDG